MMTEKPAHFQDLEQCVEALLGQVGKKVVIGGGFGRPIHIFNELFRRASEDPGIELTIITGLSTNKPRASSDLEKRFMDPFVERVFGNLPDLAYVSPYVKQQLPKNIEVVEIFLAAGAYLNNPTAQQNYVYSNFTHWFRDMIDLGLNVFGQQVSSRMIDGELAYRQGDPPLDHAGGGSGHQHRRARRNPVRFAYILRAPVDDRRL